MKLIALLILILYLAGLSHQATHFKYQTDKDLYTVLMK